MKVVIMAGGKGTRIASLFSDIPKPLIPICGKPILERQISILKKQGFEDFIITVGYLSDKIINYFGDGSFLDVHIKYFIEEMPLGNAGALFKLKSELKDTFLLLNADSLFDVDFKRMINYHNEKGGLATIFVHPNSHPYDSGLVITDSNSSVVNWISKEEERKSWYKNQVNAGIHIISPSILDMEIIGDKKVDLDRDLLKPLCGTGKLFAYSSPEYVKDMGTPERYLMVCNDYNNGLVESKNLLNKQKAIFLDRDGTINKYVGFLRNIDDLELTANASEAIRLINSSEYLSIVVTNQPVIARGEVTIDELNDIHNKLETLLGKDGAYLDKIYYCPHHPDKGFEGERAEYKINCECRKPKPGMLLKAAKDFNIDLSNSWMIGDDDNDILAGKNAGCKTIFIGKEGECLNSPTFFAKDILEAVRMVLKNE